MKSYEIYSAPNTQETPRNNVVKIQLLISFTSSEIPKVDCQSAGYNSHLAEFFFWNIFVGGIKMESLDDFGDDLSGTKKMSSIFEGQISPKQGRTFQSKQGTPFGFLSVAIR